MGDDPPDGTSPSSMAFETRQAPRLSPTSVTVHDDRDVTELRAVHGSHSDAERCEAFGGIVAILWHAVCLRVGAPADCGCAPCRVVDDME